MPTVVLAALAAAGRLLFAPVPSFKPVSAVCILAGAVFGRRSGFLVGALAALVSNFFLGQGPWTPWQMYAWGLVGYLAGVLADRGWLDRLPVLFAFGFSSALLYGLLLNGWYVIGFVPPFSWPAALLAFGAALPFDATHGAATVAFLAALYVPSARSFGAHQSASTPSCSRGGARKAPPRPAGRIGRACCLELAPPAAPRPHAPRPHAATPARPAPARRPHAAPRPHAPRPQDALRSPRRLSGRRRRVIQCRPCVCASTRRRRRNDSSRDEAGPWRYGKARWTRRRKRSGAARRSCSPPTRCTAWAWPWRRRAARRPCSTSSGATGASRWPGWWATPPIWSGTAGRCRTPRSRWRVRTGPVRSRWW